MKPNNARAVLGGLNQRRPTRQAADSASQEANGFTTAAPLDAEDPGVAEYLSTLRTEWTKSEGIRVEAPLEEAFDSFKPIAWSRPSNLGSVQDDLRRTGRTKQALTYDVTDIAHAVDTLQRTHPRVARLDHPVKGAVVEKAEWALAGCRAFASLRSQPSNVHVTNWSLGYYGRPDRTVIEAAQEILSIDPDESSEERLLDAEEIQHTFRQGLADLHEWSVVVAPIQAVMAIRPNAREILVRQGAMVNASELHRLWVHEVGGHVVRTLNASQSPGSLAQLKLGLGSTATEEGMAVWWEHRLGARQHNVMRRYAARALAVDMALNFGASDIMDALAPVMGVAEATTIIMRVKRGMSDAEAPGAFTKDHSYLSGYIAVRDFLSRRPELIHAVMATKWSLEMTPLAQQLIDDRVLLAGRMPWEVINGFSSPSD